MNKRDELIAKYKDDLQEKCGIVADMDLLRKVTIGCGPTIYNRDSATVSSSDEGELETVKKNFLIKKLKLSEGGDLDAGLNAVIEQYGRSNRTKYRAVMYYLLVKHFKCESIYATAS